MYEPPPKLFERIPPKFFGPLAAPYSELYWELLASLYQQEYEREPFLVLKPTAILTAEEAIRRSRSWADRPLDLERLMDEEDVPRAEARASASSEKVGAAGVAQEDDVVRGLARRLVAALERAGWLHVQFRAGMGELVSFHPYAARIADVLLRVARDEQPVFQGYVHSIAALLEPRAFAQRPGVSLAEATKHTIELTTELKILERNIHSFTQRILEEATTAAAVLEEGFERYENAVMASYHRLKTVDNVFRQRSAILERLDAIERDGPALTSAAAWYAEQRRLGSVEARVAVAKDLALLRSRFDAIPAMVDEIDTRNARFSGAALQKLRYLLRQERRTEGQLQAVVEALARGDAPDLEFDVFRCELLPQEGFLYTAPTDRPKPAPQELAERPSPDKGTIRGEVGAKLRRPFSRRRIEAFVLALIGNRDEARISEIPVARDEDYVRLIYLAAYGLDGDSNYTLDPEDDRLRRGPYGFADGHLRPRGARRRARRPGAGG
ncbi:MAG TPA: Wadjet anti-phage system protein JetA family protein [Planctomycetota bacterium]|nr:Wadjet anti-phage system protein JetA family protein [Planctomycetota bacterium]